MVAPEIWISPESESNLSCDHKSAHSFPRAGGPKPQRQDGLTGFTGLNINYSSIFTEISFYPETSILLQIV